MRTDSLAISATLLVSHKDFLGSTYTIEMIFRPSVPDNSDNWQLFNDDQHIINFLQTTDNLMTCILMVVSILQKMPLKVFIQKLVKDFYNWKAIRFLRVLFLLKYCLTSMIAMSKSNRNQLLVQWSMSKWILEQMIIQRWSTLENVILIKKGIGLLHYCNNILMFWPTLMMTLSLSMLKIFIMTFHSCRELLLFVKRKGSTIQIFMIPSLPKFRKC